MVADIEGRHLSGEAALERTAHRSAATRRAEGALAGDQHHPHRRRATDGRGRLLAGALPPLPVRAGGAEYEGLERVVRRADAVEYEARALRTKDDELADMVTGLTQRLHELVRKSEAGEEKLDRLVEYDSQRSGQTKRMHEELEDEFREFNNWHVLEPRSWMWRTLYKLGFYVSVLLSFMFVVPFTAIYSKALRFKNRRLRASSRRERPAWTTGHGEIEPDFVSSDFFPEGGLARLNPLRLSSGSLVVVPAERSAEESADSAQVVVQPMKEENEERSGVAPSNGKPAMNSESHVGEQKSEKSSRPKRRSAESSARNVRRFSRDDNGSTERTVANESTKHRRSQSANSVDTSVARSQLEGATKPSWALHDNRDFNAIELDSSSDFWAIFNNASPSKSQRQK